MKLLSYISCALMCLFLVIPCLVFIPFAWNIIDNSLLYQFLFCALCLVLFVAFAVLTMRLDDLSCEKRSKWGASIGAHEKALSHLSDYLVYVDYASIPDSSPDARATWCKEAKASLKLAEKRLKEARKLI